MQVRKEKFLGHIADGMNIDQACAELRLSRKTYEKWRQRDPHFKRMADSVRVGSSRVAQNFEGNFNPRSHAQFRLRYFGHESPPVHIEIADALDVPGRISLVLIPPFHGKTTNLADWMSQQIALEPNTRIGYVTESQALARKVCGRLRRRMTEAKENAKYIEDYGPFYVPGQEKQAKPWSTDYFTVYRADHDEQDYTFEALGWNSQIYGARWDVGVLDDYQTLRNTRNPKVTDDMVERFQQDILTRVDLEEGGRIIIIGTRVAQRDFYSEISNTGVADVVIIRPAIDGQGRPLWEKKWDIEKLGRQRKRVQEKVWHRAYMMRPQDEGAATFTETAMNGCLNMGFRIHQAAETNEDVWAGLDPAIDKYTAITALALTPYSARFVEIRHEWELATGEAIMALIYETWERVRFSKLMVEAVSFQKALARDERLYEMKEKCGFEIVEHVTAGNKQDETYGLARMASQFIDRSFILPAADEDSRKASQLLIDEALSWRATIPTRDRTQDILMTVWFQWLRWQTMRLKERKSQKEVKGNGMPFAPTSLPGGLTEYAPYVPASR
jgi:hypothetical protein